MSLSAERSLVSSKKEYLFVPPELEPAFEQAVNAMTRFLPGMSYALAFKDKPVKLMAYEEQELLQEFGFIGFFVSFLYPDEVDNAAQYDEPFDYAYELYASDLRTEIQAENRGQLSEADLETRVHDQLTEDIDIYVQDTYYYVSDDEKPMSALVEDIYDYLQERRIAHIIYREKGAVLSHVFPQNEVW